MSVALQYSSRILDVATKNPYGWQFALRLAYLFTVELHTPVVLGCVCQVSLRGKRYGQAAVSPFISFNQVRNTCLFRYVLLLSRFLLAVNLFRQLRYYL